MATNYRSAVLNGTMAAARLHNRLGTRAQVEARGGNIDIFGVINGLHIPLLLRPLKGLLGAYLNAPAPGILVTTERRMPVQRFTAAHELGHSHLLHDPSLDDEGILRRAMVQQASPTPPSGHLQEIEADSFAIEFLTPRWLIKWHADQQKWRAADFEKPDTVYQLALRLGTSYTATCWTLSRYKFLSPPEARRLTEIQPKRLKEALLADHRPTRSRPLPWSMICPVPRPRGSLAPNDARRWRLHDRSSRKARSRVFVRRRPRSGRPADVPRLRGQRRSCRVARRLGTPVLRVRFLSIRHAVVAIGHGIAGDRAILIRNSWGVDWGVGGCAWLTESFLTPRLMRLAALTEETNGPNARQAA